MATRSEERAQFYADILTTGIESGYEWFEYDNIVRTPDGGYESATVRECDLEAENLIDAYTDRGTVNADTIAKAFGLIAGVEGSVEYLNPATRKRFLAAYREMDAGEFDVCDADTILQLGILGAIVYA